MANAVEILRQAHTVLVIDWPSRDVPDTLARAGFTVVVRGGPGPEDYSVQEVIDGKVVPRHLGAAPEHADLVYSHRPIGELPGIVSTARELGATSLWRQSGLASSGVKDPKGCWVAESEAQQARQIVESAGLNYFEQPYIADAVRRMTGATG
jgi:predicted CoA-binding protein